MFASVCGILYDELWEGICASSYACKLMIFSNAILSSYPLDLIESRDRNREKIDRKIDKQLA